MAPRAQPYRISWPLNAASAEAIDEMLQILFDDLRNGSITIGPTQIINNSVTDSFVLSGLTAKYVAVRVSLNI